MREGLRGKAGKCKIVIFFHRLHPLTRDPQQIEPALQATGLQTTIVGTNNLSTYKE